MTEDLTDAPFHYPKPKRAKPSAVAIKNNDATMLYRLPRKLKDQFEEACHAKGFLPPTILRTMMQKFIDKCISEGVQL